MKKIIVITDGRKLRAIRISDHQCGSELRIRYTEIRSTDLDSRKVEPSDGCLSGIADQISHILAEEEPLFWNLAAPQGLLDPLLRRLDGESGQCPARAVADDLAGASLPDIAVRFPPMPCRPWSPSGLPAKKNRRRAPVAAGRE